MKSHYPNSLTDCDGIDSDELDPGRHIVLVPKPNQGVLTEKERMDYWNYRKAFLTF